MCVTLQDLNYDSRPYSAWGAYGQSKLCNILFARELAERWEALAELSQRAPAHAEHTKPYADMYTASSVATASRWCGA